jgi:membrane protease YdiL (CAAX protease family)
VVQYGRYLPDTMAAEIAKRVRANTVLVAFLLAMVLEWCRQQTGSVIGVVGAHGLLNVLVHLILPVPTP